MQINIENDEYADSIDEAALIDLIQQLAALAQSEAEAAAPWEELTLHLLSDSTIAPIHQAVNGEAGTTDVITQRYDPFPGEPEGLIGEIFVNLQCAARESRRIASESAAGISSEGVLAPQLKNVREGAAGISSGGVLAPRLCSSAPTGQPLPAALPEAAGEWSADMELALYIAHGCDHLNDSEDSSDAGRLAMRLRELGWLKQLHLTPVIIKPIL